MFFISFLLNDNCTLILIQNPEFYNLFFPNLVSKILQCDTWYSYTPLQYHVLYTLSGRGVTPQVSYTHTEISDNSTGLLHPHRNFGFLHGSLTPTQKFGISPQVSYTHTEIWDLSPGLLHPHRTFRILPRVSFTLTQGFSP